MLFVVHNYYYLLALLLIQSLRTSICVCKYLYMILPLSMTGGGQGRWPWLFRRHHQVHGHFPHPWNYIYYPLKWLYLSGWSWFQFSIMVSVETGESAQPLTTAITDQRRHSSDSSPASATDIENLVRIFITFFNISSFTAHIQRFWMQITNSSVFAKIFISQKWVLFLIWPSISTVFQTNTI